MKNVQRVFFALFILLGMSAVTSPAFDNIEYEIFEGKINATELSKAQFQSEQKIKFQMELDLRKMDVAFEEYAKNAGVGTDEDVPMLSQLSQLIYIAEKSLESVSDPKSSPVKIKESLSIFNQAKVSFFQILLGSSL